MNPRILAAALILGSGGIDNGFAQVSDPNTDPNRDIKFEQRVGQMVSADIDFTNESGRRAVLGNYFHQRPIVLALGYYECPMLCGVVLNALVQSLEDLPPTLAKRDFNFLFVSIDPLETSALAKGKLEDYLRRYGWAPAAERWHFLTGSEASIGRLAAQVGFHYRYDAVSKQYVHPSGLVVLTPSGRISSYLLGIEYPAKTIDHAITLARDERATAPAAAFTLLCFSQNFAPGTVAFIVLMVLRVGAVLTLMGLAIIIYRASRGAKRKTVP
ncbi:MAG: SCO family protein [Chthoniobacterales bacterium]